MQSVDSKLLLLGLRSSGKTSFLAALWHLVEANEIHSSLIAPNLQPDRTHLNYIRAKWLRFEEMDRTTLRSFDTVSLELTDKDTNGQVFLSVPDISGEQFSRQWITRETTKKLADYMKHTTGILLFIHPLNLQNAQQIPALTEPHADKETLETQIKEWSPDLSPIQVQLVELIQFAQALRVIPTQLRISVIVSAWDTVPERTLPISWLENQMPLLFQFLNANLETSPFRIYGVSALGGDLKKDREKLERLETPSTRITVISSSLKPDHDLTAPIRFLLSAEQN